MYSDNPLYFDGRFIIFIQVCHGESCSENIQCEDLVEAQCFPTNVDIQAVSTTMEVAALSILLCTRYTLPA